MQTQAHLKLGTCASPPSNSTTRWRTTRGVIEHDARGDLALDALENYATVCKAIDAWTRAVAAYELLLQRKPDTAMQAKTRFDVAYCYYRAGKYDRAYALFTEVLPELATPELKAEAQFWMGACRFDQEDYEQAVNEYLKVSYSYPDLAQWSATAELKAADAYVRMGKTDRARSLLERIIAKYAAPATGAARPARVLERLCPGS
jgi:TolA-binding protein